METEGFEIDKTGILLQYHGNGDKVVVPDVVTEIGAHAFQYCEQMEHITFPENLKRIDRFAFLHCSSLAHITLPNFFQMVEDHTFAFCKKLENVSFVDTSLDVKWQVVKRTRLLDKSICETLTPTQKIKGITSFRNCSPQLQIQGTMKKMSTEDFLWYNKNRQKIKEDVV